MKMMKENKKKIGKNEIILSLEYEIFLVVVDVAVDLEYILMIQFLCVEFV